MRQIKTAIVGCGMISNIYIKNLKNLFSVIDLAALCDLNEANAKEKSELFGVPIRSMDEIKADPEIELISLVDREPSFWRDSLDRDGEGLHHIAFYTGDIQGDLARLNQSGFVTIQQGSWPESPRDGYYAYADTRDKLKCTVELLDFLK